VILREVIQEVVTMSDIRVSGRCVIPAEKGKVFLLSTEYLCEEGLSCRQIKKVQSESDFINGILSRSRGILMTERSFIPAHPIPGLSAH